MEDRLASDAPHVYSLRAERVYSSSMFTTGETQSNCDANEPREEAQGTTDLLREIKKQKSVRAAKKETSGNHRAMTKDNIISNQLSTQP